MSAITQHPRLVREVGGFRFYIGETPIHAGDGVVIEFSDTASVEFRFEWSSLLQDTIRLYPAKGPGLSVPVDTFRAMYTRVPGSPTPRYRP